MNVDGALKPKAIVLRKNLNYVEWLIWIGHIPFLWTNRIEGYVFKVQIINLDIAKSHRVRKSTIFPGLVGCRFGSEVYMCLRIIIFLARLRIRIRYANLGNVQVCCEPDKESLRRGSNGDLSEIWSVIITSPSEFYSSFDR
jgi:hypothetical protein